MLAIPELDGRFLHTWLADSRSKGTASLGSAPAIRRYEVRLYRINTHEVTIYSAGGLGKAEGVVLAIPEPDVRFLHNRVSDSRSEDGTSLDPAPATCRYKERHCHINTHEIAIYSGGGGPGQAKRGCWRSQNSMADSSTNSKPILYPSVGRHRARCQLHAGINDVAIASILMKSLSTLGGFWEG